MKTSERSTPSLRTRPVESGLCGDAIVSGESGECDDAMYRFFVLSVLTFGDVHVRHCGRRGLGSYWTENYPAPGSVWANTVVLIASSRMLEKLAACCAPDNGACSKSGGSSGLVA